MGACEAKRSRLPNHFPVVVDPSRAQVGVAHWLHDEKVEGQIDAEDEVEGAVGDEEGLGGAVCCWEKGNLWHAQSASITCRRV